MRLLKVDKNRLGLFARGENFGPQNGGHHFAAGVNRYALALPRRCRGIDTRLAVTTSRCVSCGAKIAPVTVLVRAASAPLLLAKHSSVIADPVHVHVVRGTESRARGEHERARRHHPGRLVVYRSENVRPGSGNAVAWNGGGDVEAIADTLRAKGVRLEEYPALGMRIDRGVHTSDGFAAIWFKDPDGNVLHVNSAR